MSGEDVAELFVQGWGRDVQLGPVTAEGFNLFDDIGCLAGVARGCDYFMACGEGGFG